ARARPRLHPGRGPRRQPARRAPARHADRLRRRRRAAGARGRRVDRLGARARARAGRARMTAEPFALYVHVPWCRHVCPYCDFNVYAAAEPPERPYVEAEAARAAGFANLSLDLIFAVPGQTLADWEDDLGAALALAPEHVSAYALTYEPGTPFHAWRASGRLRPVDEDGEAAMAERTVERLAAAGYERYEISSFTRPGFASRHNTSYWDGSDYLGLGAGAHSFSAEPAPGRRWAN